MLSGLRCKSYWQDHGPIEDYPEPGFNNYHLLVCNACGCMHRQRLKDDGEPRNSNFCPNCGCNMIRTQSQKTIIL